MRFIIKGVRAKVAFVIAVMSIIISVPVAWCFNVAKLIDCDFKTPYRCEVMHSIGTALPPLSVITVWFATDEE
jgi:hypothetical protein